MLTILIDNNSHPTADNLLTEHGLSIYWELNGLKYMLDVGASDHFLQNANNLNIRIEDIDYLFLSHAHKDHTGGLQSFLEVNKKAKIYLSKNVLNRSFYSSRKGSKRDISMPEVEISSRFRLIEEDCMINKDIKVIAIIPQIFQKPLANRTLLSKTIAGEGLDNFDHEICLRIKTDKGFLILSACTHNGILNTLSACCGDEILPSEIVAYIGGTHLLDSDDTNQYETHEDISVLCDSLLKSYPHLQLITGHCTGSTVMQIFKEKMGERFQQFYSGFHFRI